jgi:hypothetical protein
MSTRPRRERRIRRTLHFDLESLDDRIVPSTIGGGRHIMPPVPVVRDRSETQAPRRQPRDAQDGGHGNPADATGLPANVERTLQSVYAQYLKFVGIPAGGTTASTQFSEAAVSSASLVIKVHTNDTADFQHLLEHLRGSGLRVTGASAASGNVRGSVPITSLPAVASLSPALTATLPTNLDWRLQSLQLQYQAFVNSGGKGAFSPTVTERMVINGTDVGVRVTTIDVRQFPMMLAELEKDGFRVNPHSVGFGVVDGDLPIAQLSNVAKISPMVAIKPLLKPHLR